MIIAFEGPDNVGKTHSAGTLDHTGTARYNMTKGSYEGSLLLHQKEKGLVSAFDRIDWLTHTVYRLALPTHEWNDPRVRTVFAAPEAHLVFKLHHPDSVPASDEEEGYADGVPMSVNDMYGHVSHMIMQLNEVRNYSLFKTVTIMEVDTRGGQFKQRIVDFSSPLYPWGTSHSKIVKDDESLLELLLAEEARR